MEKCPDLSGSTDSVYIQIGFLIKMERDGESTEYYICRYFLLVLVTFFSYGSNSLPVSRSVGWLVGWSVGRLVGWSVGR